MDDAGQSSNTGVHCTAGAIPMKNEKGQMYMQKVKVQRYMAGKRPGFASDSDSDGEFDQRGEGGDVAVFQTEIPVSFISQGGGDDDQYEQTIPTEQELRDPRFRRLMQLKQARLEMDSENEAEDENEERDEEGERLARHKRHRNNLEEQEENERRDSEEENDEDMDEEEMVKRRELIRQRALQARRKREEEELKTGTDILGGANGYNDEGLNNENQFERGKDDDKFSDEEEEEYSSSDEDDDDMVAPKLKPVFVRASERITLQAKQRADEVAREAAEEARRLTDERRRDTLKMLESEIRREAEDAQVMEDELDALDSDDAHGDASKEQEEYERWKVRELKRIRRDREIRESFQQDKDEIERIRNLTDEQRREEFRRNPKEITNKAAKGKYKFLQKYFHRGAFFVSTEDDNLYKRDVAEPTLEDHFDKTKLPAVMQVKNFGRAGQTKYTHLVDQDTTEFDVAWTATNPQALKFQMAHGGGFKDIFDKPRLKKKN